MSLSGKDAKALHQALRAAFPTRKALRAMLRFGLSISLDDIVERSALAETIMDLISWAEAHGQLAELVLSARTENPKHPGLRAVAVRLGFESSAPEPSNAASTLDEVRKLEDVDRPTRGSASSRDESVAKFRPSATGADPTMVSPVQPGDQLTTIGPAPQTIRDRVENAIARTQLTKAELARRLQLDTADHFDRAIDEADQGSPSAMLLEAVAHQLGVDRSDLQPRPFRLTIRDVPQEHSDDDRASGSNADAPIAPEVKSTKDNVATDHVRHDSNHHWQARTHVIRMEPKTPPGAGGAGDCLVIIYSKESANLGKRFALDPSMDGLTIGRGGDNAIVLESDSVSRKHARFEQKEDRWWVTDLRSTNGTYVNDEQVNEHRLRGADHIKIGDTIFKYLAGSDVEAAYHEEIYRMTIVDGLTQAYNKRFLFEQLDKEISRARRYGRPLALIMFDLDHFKKINDTYGHIAGDYVLREVSALVRGRIRRDEVFARYGGEEFAVLLPETDQAGALRLAEEMRAAIANNRFVFDDSIIPVTISVGVVMYAREMRDELELLELADRYLYLAKEGGRDCVVSEKLGKFGRPLRKRLDGPWLLRRALSRDTIGPLIGFEIANELSVVESLGTAGWDKWMRELFEDVESSTGDQAYLGVWRDRYVLAAPSEEQEVPDIIQRVTTAWADRAGAIDGADPSIPPRLLRAAQLTASELVSHGDRSLDALLGRLARSHAPVDSENELIQDLPFPLAAPLAMVETRRTALGRVKSLLDSLESALRFLVSVEFAVLRASPDLEVRQGLVEEARLFSGPLTIEQWAELAQRLATNFPRKAYSNNAVGQVMRGFGQVSGKRSALAKIVHDATVVRQSVAKRIGVSEDAYGSDEARVRQALSALLSACRPFARMRMVSVVDIEQIEDDETFSYALAVHRGTSEYFKIVKERLPIRLQKGWSYLIDSAGSTSSLVALSPIVAAQTCSICGRIEVFLADEIIFGPRRAKTRVRGVTSNHEATIEVAWNRQVEQFYNAVSSPSGPQ